LEVLELVFKSPVFRLASENDAYALVGGWVAGRPVADQQGAFERLVKCLRLHHMSAAFLTSVVIRSKFRHEWPGLLGLCTNALTYQSMAASLSPLLRRADHLPAPPSLFRRSPAAFEYQLEAQVLLADCLNIDQRPGRKLQARLGVAEGYLIELSVSKAQEPGGQATVGLYLGLRRPNTTAEQYEAGDIVPFTGAIVKWQVDINGKTVKDAPRVYRGTYRLRGFPNFFEKPWEEVVREGSEYFPQGSMTVEAKARFISDRHVNGEEK
jgi:hypothetical protein